MLGENCMLINLWLNISFFSLFFVSCDYSPGGTPENSRWECLGTPNPVPLIKNKTLTFCMLFCCAQIVERGGQWGAKIVHRENGEGGDVFFSFVFSFFFFVNFSPALYYTKMGEVYRLPFFRPKRPKNHLFWGDTYL